MTNTVAQINKSYTRPSLQPLYKRFRRKKFVNRFIKSLDFDPLTNLSAFNRSLNIWEQRFLNISGFHSENLAWCDSEVSQPILEVLYKYSKHSDKFEVLLGLTLQIDILSCQILDRLYKKMAILGLSNARIENVKIKKVVFFIGSFSFDMGINSEQGIIALNLWNYLNQRSFPRKPMSHSVNEASYAHEIGHSLEWEIFPTDFDNMNYRNAHDVVMGKLEGNYSCEYIRKNLSQVIAQWFAILLAGEEKVRMRHDKLAKIVDRDDYLQTAYILAVANEMKWETENINRLRKQLQRQEGLQYVIESFQDFFSNLKLRIK